VKGGVSRARQVRYTPGRGRSFGISSGRAAALSAASLSRGGMLKWSEARLGLVTVAIW